MSHPIRRSIICQICNRARQTQSWFDICPKCARKHLPRMHCDACNQSKFQLQPNSAICHGCLKTLLKEKITCAACGVTDYPYISDPAALSQVPSKGVPAQLEKVPERKTIDMYLMWEREAGMEKERDDLLRLRRESEDSGTPSACIQVAISK